MLDFDLQAYVIFSMLPLREIDSTIKQKKKKFHFLVKILTLTTYPRILPQAPPAAPWLLEWALPQLEPAGTRGTAGSCPGGPAVSTDSPSSGAGRNSTVWSPFPATRSGSHFTRLQQVHNEQTLSELGLAGKLMGGV